MATAKQIAANQANSKKSSGPRTEAGLQTSSLNSLKHGLTGHVSRTYRQDDAWHAYCDSMLPALAPSGALEHDLAARIVHDSWLLHRAGAINENLLFNGAYEHRHGGLPADEDSGEADALAEAHAFRTDAGAFNLLSLYQQRLERSVHKNLAVLQTMQDARNRRHSAGFQQHATALKAALQQHADAAVQSPQHAPQPIASTTPSPEIGFVYASAPADDPPPLEPTQNAPETMAA